MAKLVETSDLINELGSKDLFKDYNLMKYCCHCNLPESAMREYKIQIVRRTDGKTVERTKKTNLVMSPIPSVFCMEIRNSYSFVCDVCTKLNDIIIEKASHHPVNTEDLFKAVRAGNSGHANLIARRLSRKQLNANGDNNKWGDSALHIACQSHFLDVAEVLLANGADINVKNIGGETPLYQMANMGRRKDILALLVEQGAQVNFHINNGSFPLQAACVTGDPAYVSELVKGGSHVNFQNSVDGSTAMHKCCALAEPECLRELLLARASRHIRNNAGVKPLEFAVKRTKINPRYAECVKLMETRRFADVLRIRLASDPDPEEVAAVAENNRINEKIAELEKDGVDAVWEKYEKPDGTPYWFCLELDLISDTDPTLKETKEEEKEEQKKSDYADRHSDDEGKESKTAKDWIVRYDTNGYKFWENKNTKESAYNNPESERSAILRANDAGGVEEQSDIRYWVEHYDEENQVPYWYNQKDGSSTYNDPFASHYTPTWDQGGGEKEYELYQDLHGDDDETETGGTALNTLTLENLEVHDEAVGIEQGSDIRFWVEYYDEENQVPYWYNQKDGTSTYDNPFASQSAS